MTDYNTIYVGIDAHKNEHAMYIIDPNNPEEMRCTVKNNSKELQRFISRLLKKFDNPIKMCYEAGCNGFRLQRELTREGVTCDVIAPSLVPVKPGERIKTDHRDAKNLAELLKSGMLTTVHPPTEAEEAVREVCRCRDMAKKSHKKACQNLGKFLIRQHKTYSEGSSWTQKHFRWLHQLKFYDPKLQYSLEDLLYEVERCIERVKKIEQQIGLIAQSDEYREKVGWLRCFRGIDTTTAMVIISELFGFERFNDAHHLMSFLGLTPSEHSSGLKQRRGCITKAGNSRVRRILVEASWHQRHRANVGKALSKRRAGQPCWVIATADKAMRRLNQKYRRMIKNGKKENVAITAVARELAGFIWSVLYPRQEMVQEKVT